MCRHQHQRQRNSSPDLHPHQRCRHFRHALDHFSIRVAVAQSPLAVSNGTFTCTCFRRASPRFVVNRPPTRRPCSQRRLHLPPTQDVSCKSRIRSPIRRAAQTLTFVLLTAPPMPRSHPRRHERIVHVAPLISQADSTNTIRIKVTDSGFAQLERGRTASSSRWRRQPGLR